MKASGNAKPGGSSPGQEARKEAVEAIAEDNEEVEEVEEEEEAEVRAINEASQRSEEAGQTQTTKSEPEVRNTQQKPEKSCHHTHSKSTLSEQQLIPSSADCSTDEYIV